VPVNRNICRRVSVLGGWDRVGAWEVARVCWALPLGVGSMSSSAIVRNHFGQRGGLRMPEKNLDAPDIAGLVRGAAAGDRFAWERLVDQFATGRRKSST
jgi:hypothetical protein